MIDVSIEEAMKRMTELHCKRADLWEKGTFDSYRYNRFDLDAEYAQEMAELQKIISKGV